MKLIRRPWGIALFIVILILWGTWRALQTTDSAPPDATSELALNKSDTALPKMPVIESTPKPIAPSRPQVQPGVPPDPEKTPTPPTASERIRTDMKMSLSSIYSAEKAFYAEAGRYSTDFDVIGWMPVEQILTAKVGFLDPFATETDEYADRSDRLDTDQLVEASQSFDEIAMRYTYAESATRVNIRSLYSYCEQGCTANREQFEVIAAANLDEDDDLDIWRINERKELVHVSDDLPAEPQPNEPRPQTPSQKPDLLEPAIQETAEPSDNTEPIPEPLEDTSPQ